ncbi:MAG: helix-turn-helix transcriptional regulator [Pseudomonadota bacterium]
MANYLTTREVAELLRIKERKVYDLASSGALPCSRAMGKLLFPEEGVHAWLAGNETGERPAAPRPGVFLGSHDPLLDWALRESGCGLATFFDGSSDGLRRFALSEGIAAGLHIFEPDTGDWNLGAAAQLCAGSSAVLVRWASRARGLVLQEGHAAAVSGLDDVSGLRLVARQEDAGAQKLFSHLVAERQIDIGAPAIIARSESDAVLAVIEGKADVAFGLEALASPHRLGFVPVIEERFDLLVDRSAWFDPPWQTFWDFCRSVAFRTRAGELKGYDVSGLGTVLRNGF